MKRMPLIATSVASLAGAFVVAYVVTKPDLQAPTESPTMTATTSAAAPTVTADGAAPEEIEQLLDLNSTLLEDEILAELAKSMLPLDEYLAAFEQNPEDQTAVTGILHHVQDMPPETAEPLLRRLLAKAPAERAFIDQLGWVILYEEQRYKDAIAFFTPLFTATKGGDSPGNPAIAELLANSYAAMKDVDKAIFYARAATATGVDPGLELQLGHFELDKNDIQAAKITFERGQQKLRDLRQSQATKQDAAAGLQPEELQLIPVEISLGIGQAKVHHDLGDKARAAGIIASLEQRLAELRLQVGALSEEPDTGFKDGLKTMLERQETAVLRSKDRLQL